MAENTQALIVEDALIFGKVPPPTHVRVEVVLAHQPDFAQSDLRVTVTAEERMLTVAGTMLRVERRQVAGQHSIPHSLMHLARDPGVVLRDAITNLLRKMAPHLTEHDPRRGMFHDDFVAGCPLFDPDTIRTPRYRHLDGPFAVPCTLCASSFTRDHPPMWAGGLLQWVHERCWVGLADPGHPLWPRRATLADLRRGDHLGRYLRKKLERTFFDDLLAPYQDLLVPYPGDPCRDRDR